MRTEKITAENVDNVQLKKLYESAFPKEERIPYDELKGLLGVMPIDFMAYYDEDVFVGLTMVLNREDFNWGWYFAVREELRGRGYGQHILTALKAKYADRRLVIDIESPWQTDCNNKEQRCRRYEFISVTDSATPRRQRVLKVLTTQFCCWGKERLRKMTTTA